MGAINWISQNFGPLALFAAIPLLITSYFLSLFFYNIFLHPLRRFPGPWINAATPIPYILQSISGNSVSYVVSLHEKYGEVVRFTPHELSFSGADAIRDIYGHKKAGLPTLNKDASFYKNPTGDLDIVNAGFHDHARMRRVFSNAFSDRSLKLQEPLFNKYVDQLVEKMSEGVAQNSKVFNMVQMYNFTTFDVMGDLTFGEPLDMLTNSAYTPWVAALFSGFKFGTYLHAIRYFPGVEDFLLKYCIPESIRANMKLHKELSHQRVDRRLEKKNDARPDIWGLVLAREEGSGLTKEEMYSNSNLFMIAGTETTATLLSGLTFYLLTNPEKLAKLTQEIRAMDEITIEKMQALPYLNACIEEGLRMYPPVSNGLPRLTPEGPATQIDGHDVPAGTRVMVTNLAAYRNPRNWRDPHSFVPERFLAPSQSPQAKLYVADKRHALQPFSTGPRACLGKNMAYHEMRLILCKVLYNFDMELCEDCKDWNQQKIFIMWNKQDLNVRLTPVVR